MAVIMRRKPVTRSEIRYDGKRVTTLPIDAVRKDKWGDAEPLRKLWAPLLRSLNRESKRTDELFAKDRREHVPALKVLPWEPIRCPQPYCALLGPHTCQQCRRKFYRVIMSSDRFCCDDCAEARGRERRATRNAAMVEARSQERVAARADRRCANPDCNKPLPAQRSTMKYCTVRCRVAAHRAGKGSAQS
jgi:hypothetical protein